VDEDDYEDARMLLEDAWLVFVTQNLKTIDNILSYNERVWLQAGKKENLMKRVMENLTT
jgi:hypothetical protein